MRRRAVITGATGVTGGHLARMLVDAGWDVTALCRAGSDVRGLAQDAVRIVRIDAAESPSAVASAVDEALGTDAPQAVFSLATQRSDRTLAEAAAMFDANVRLPAVLVAGLADRGGGILVTSASYMLGAHGVAPSMFSSSRGAIDPVLAWASAHAGVRVATLSFSSIYGPGDERAKVLAALFAAATGGTPLDMVDPARELDMVHVTDASTAFVRAAGLLVDGTVDSVGRYDVSSGCRVSLEELVSLVEHATGMPIDARWGLRRASASDSVVAPDAPNWLPGWLPLVTLEAGLREIAQERSARISP